MVGHRAVLVGTWILGSAVGSGRLVGGRQHAGGGRNAVDESERGQWAAVGDQAMSRSQHPGPRRGRPGACMTPSSVGLVNPTPSLMFLLAGSAGTVPAAHPGFGPAGPRTVGRILWLRWKRWPGS